MALIFTAPMAKRMTPRVRRILEDSLRCFPELQGKSITVGYTRGALGVAYMPMYGSGESMGIRLKVRHLVYNTVGHELTHLVQWLSQMTEKKAATEGLRIPGGEKQCDIWTLARSDLFCDDAPTYLKLPYEIRENWSPYAGAVRSLCVAAIEKRKAYRYYIRWLEDQIHQLARKKKPKDTTGVSPGRLHSEAPVQGWLPFV
jgi:hypothetical protein